ncbi:uncharacterized protein V6R79_015280 [Siganus canaliculatus]
MPPWGNQPCQIRALLICSVTFLVFLVGLLIFLVSHLTLSRQDAVGEDFVDTTDNFYEDCASRVAAVADEVIMQTWKTNRNISQVWSKAAQNAREPAHSYMEKVHSIAIYMFTNIIQRTAKQTSAAAAERTRKNTVEPDSLYFTLSEAIQTLKQSQVMCLSTNYRTEAHLNLSISNKHLRFSSFLIGSDSWTFANNSSCFEVYTCFGADITYYSALTENNQVLIPPYEVFKVTDIEMGAQDCEVVYTLKSNLDCVYDRETNTLHPISTLTVSTLCLIFLVICLIIGSLLLPFLIFKTHKKLRETAAFDASSLHNSACCPARVVI